MLLVGESEDAMLVRGLSLQSESLSLDAGQALRLESFIFYLRGPST